MTPETLDTTGAAEFLGITEDRMKVWRRVGGGPPFIPWGPRTIRYRVSDLREFLAKQATAKNTAEAAAMLNHAA